MSPDSFEREKPAIIPVRDIKAPTERSIPLESITSVIPSETMRRTDPWRTRLVKFVMDRKLGERDSKQDENACKKIDGIGEFLQLIQKKVHHFILSYFHI